MINHLSKSWRIYALVVSSFIFGVYDSRAELFQEEKTKAYEELEEARELRKKKNYDHSIELSMRAAIFFTKNQFWTEAWECYNLIVKNYRSKKKYKEGLRYILKCLSEKNIQPIIGDLNYHAARLYYDLDDLENARRFYEITIAYWELGQRIEDLPKCYDRLCVILTKSGDYDRAISYGHQALILNQRSNKITKQYYNHANLFKAYLCRGKYKKASFHLDQSRTLRPDKRDGGYEYRKTELALAAGRSEGAEFFAYASLRLTQDKYGADHEYTIEAYNQLGDVYRAQGKLDRGLEWYKKALEVAKEIFEEDYRELGKSYIYMGQVYEEMGDLEEALMFYHKAFRTFTPGIEEAAVDRALNTNDLPLEIWIIEALHHKGSVYAKQGMAKSDISLLLTAFDFLNAAVRFIEKKNTSYEETGSKLVLQGYARQYYQDALRVALLLSNEYHVAGMQAKYVDLMQRARAFVLRESRSKRQALLSIGLTEVELDRINQMKLKINHYEKELIKKEHEASLRDSIEYLRFNQSQALGRLMDTIKMKYPAYDHLISDIPNAIPLEKIQSVIPRKSLLIQYLIGPDDIMIMGVTDSDLVCLMLEKPTNLDSLIYSYRRCVSDYDYITQDRRAAEKSFVSSSYKLYDVLLGPVINAFPGEEIEELVILPDGQLNEISFESLLMNETESWTTSSAYILNNYAVSYLFAIPTWYYSISVHDTQSKWTTPFSGFGITFEKAGLMAINQHRPTSPAVNHHFRNRISEPLPYADDEVRSLATMMGGTAWINEEATVGAFKKVAPKSQIIHIASHGHVNKTYPDLSHLSFFSHDVDSSFLYQADITELNISADLTVLSACHTGEGKIETSEGVMSMARAFSLAGSKSIVASNWTVADETTSKIFIEFYKNLMGGMSKNRALQAAKMTYLTRDSLSSPYYRIPYYWSSYVLIGDYKSLDLDIQSDFLNILFYMVLGIALVLFIYFFKKAH